MPASLLSTKLFIPPLRPQLVSRLRLVIGLNQGLLPGKRLILLVAPAGYGKTTLLVEWIEALQGKRIGYPEIPSPIPSLPTFCWLSLHDSDNDLQQFLSYLVEALKSVLTEEQYQTCQTALAMFPAQQEAVAQNLVVALLNSISQSTQLVVLILDDYHTINNPATHDVVKQMLTNLPPNARLVIATRSDPPLGLAQLRARDQLCELRMTDLAFTEQEVSEFLNQWMALNVSNEDITALAERTEGWAAGLHLAALAIQSPALARPEERAAFIRSFLSSHQHILEYLTEEVFNQQPESIQTFLLCTSVFERFTGPLCDAILPRKEGTHTAKDAWATYSLPSSLTGQDFLEYLEHNNLFLIRLDPQGCWFRYHPLFAGLLQAKLNHAHPGYAEILLTRAAQWSEQQQLVSDAFSQALASTNFAMAADLMERHILTFFYQSEFTQVHRWLSGLPENLLRCRPLLCAIYAASIALLPPYPPQSLPCAEKWMQAAEQAFSEEDRTTNLARAFAWKVRSYWARFRKEPPEQVMALIQEAMTILPAENDPVFNQNYQFIHSALRTNLGLTYWEMGNEAAAHQALIKARSASRACNDLLNEAAAIYCLARIQFLHGKLSEAATLCREALEYFASRRKSPGHRAPYSGEIGMLLAEILIERNQFTEAEPLVRENIELARWTMSHNILLKGYLVLARLELAKGNALAAFQYLGEAAQLSDEGAESARAQLARFWLMLSAENPGYFHLAQQWAAQQQDIAVSLAAFQGGPPKLAWNTALAQARILIAEGKPAMLTHLLNLLQPPLRKMQECGWNIWEIELRVVECLALQKIGDHSGALVMLKHALELAEPEAYMRVFIDEGHALSTLLFELEKDIGKRWPFLQKVYSALPEHTHQLPRPVISPTALEDLTEPLTAREIEVLQLLCQGKTNQEIADQLMITLNTVKKHNYSIFQKLGVTNRAEAVLLARKTGLDNTQ